MGLALRAQHTPQRLLGGGLADGTSHRDHLGIQTRARGAAEIGQACEHVLHHQQRRVGGELVALGRFDHRQRSARLQGGRNEIVPVMDVALDREIGFTLCEGAAVDGKACDRFRQRAADRRAHHLCHRH